MLGARYQDVISGFRGVAVGHVQYLTGCNQTLLQAHTLDSTKKPEPEWFDDQRLQQLVDYDVITLDNSDTPGCDKQAPKR